MTTPTNAIPAKRGFFHMLGRTWDTITVVIDSVHDLATTANLHTSNIRMTTEVELNADLAVLKQRLEASE